MSSKYKKMDGMVLVDAYWILEEEAEAYIAEREEAASRALRAFLTFCVGTDRCGEGSEDGEYIVGINSNGEYRGLIHLDPASVASILAASPEELVALLKGER